MGKLVNDVGQVTGAILGETKIADSHEIVIGGKIRATMEDLQQLSQSNLEPASQLEQIGIRYFSDTSFFSKR